MKIKNKTITTAVTTSFLAALMVSSVAQADPKFINSLSNSQTNSSLLLNLNSGDNVAHSSVDNSLKFNDNNDNSGKNIAAAPDGSADGGAASAFSLLGLAYSSGGTVFKLPIAAEVDNESVSQSNGSQSSANVLDVNLQFMQGGNQWNKMGNFNVINNDINTPEDVINQNCVVCGGNSIGKAYMGDYSKSDYSEQYKGAVIATGQSYATNDGEIYVGHNLEFGKGNINEGHGNENGPGSIDNDGWDSDKSYSYSPL